jgi:hypothetical protein
VHITHTLTDCPQSAASLLRVKLLNLIMGTKSNLGRVSWAKSTARLSRRSGYRTPSWPCRRKSGGMFSDASGVTIARAA